jgi:hypothetical protein
MNIPRMPRRLVVVIIAFAILFGGPIAASAATEPAEGRAATGFITLYNQETRQHALVACKGFDVTGIYMLFEGEAHAVGVPMGTKCADVTMPGFARVINTDPRSGGWYISAVPNLGNIQMALACTRGGELYFVIVEPDYGPYVYERMGHCHPGSVPG